MRRINPDILKSEVFVKTMNTLLSRPSVNISLRQAHGYPLAALFTALFAFSAVITAPANALTPAERFVNQVAPRAIAVAQARISLRQRAVRYRTLIRRYGAIRTISNFALGPYRRRLPPRRRAEYYRTVENFMASFLATQSRQFKGRRMEIIKSSRRGGRSTIIDARIVDGRGRETNRIQWRIIRSGRGHRIADVNVLGVWLTLQLRSHFVSILRNNNGNVDALLRVLRRGG